MLEHFTIEMFAGRIGERFAILAEGEEIGAELVSSTSLAATSGGACERPGSREPFSIVFVAPGERILPQAIYRFEHGELGSFEIFVVPIGRDERGTRYEAVFG